MITTTKKLTAIITALIMITAVISGCRSNSDELSYLSYYEYESDTQGDGSNSSVNSADGKTSSENKGGNTSNTSDKNNSTASAKPSTLKGSTVKFATWEDISKTEYGPVIEAFTKKTGIRIKIVSVPQHEYITKLTGLIAAGNSPDVIKDNGEFPRTVAIAQSIDTSGINPADTRWDQTVTKMSTVKGKVYLIASTQTNFQCRFLCYYNKRLFANNGINSPADYVNQKNWTWETFKKAASEIKTAAGLTYGVSIDTGYFNQAYGAGFVKFKNGKFYNGINENAMTDCWRYLLEGSKDGTFYLPGKSQPFIDGKAGMIISDTYGLKNAGYFSTMKVSDVGVTYLPKKTASDSVYPSTGFVSAFGIAKGAKNAAGAGEFLKFYLDMNNYDTKLIYRSTENKQFADTIAKTPITFDTLYVTTALQEISGDNFSKYMLTSDVAQIKTNLNKVNNTVNSAVSKANDMLEAAK